MIEILLYVMLPFITRNVQIPVLFPFWGIDILGWYAKNERLTFSSHACRWDTCLLIEIRDGNTPSKVFRCTNF